jgi:membrane peptidoglycan carboxypeptidase
VPTTPPDSPRPRRVRAGSVRPRGGSNGLGAGGGAARNGAEAGPASARRRNRRDLLLGRKRKAPRRRRPLLRTSLLFLALFSSIAAGAAVTVDAGYNIYLGQIPEAATVASMEDPVDTNVYAANGTLIDVIHPSGTFHLHAALTDISPYLQEATVDVEDRHFWTESSLDLGRIAEAGAGYLRHTNAGGASTIPEQLAKISFLQDNGSLAYKIKEIILGTELVNDFSKDQILEMYLNRIPYGNQAVGIQTAAELYFHEPASALDLAQSAMLAGLPQAPSEFDPDVNPAGAKQRQGTVLQAMVAVGSITQAQAAAAAAEPLKYYTWQQYLPPTIIDGANTSSFLNYLTKYYLPSLFSGDGFEDPGGYDIYTTLNLQDQALGDATVNNVVTSNPGWFVQGAAGGDGALVSLDPQNGEILAMTGSANYNSPVYGQDNLAIGERQPGSTMKLFTYTDAIASRQYTMTTQISDETMTLNGWTPKDYEGLSAGYGFCEMEYCLGNSLNLPAVRTEYAMGVLPIANLAVDAGVTLLQGQNFPSSSEYSFTLGTKPISPLDLADGAATIADLGVHHAPAPVVKITDAASGSTGLDLQRSRQRPAGGAGERRLHHGRDAEQGPPTAWRRSAPTRSSACPSRQVSAKTGTSGSGYDNYDNWTVGWTPTILTAVWVGDPQGESRHKRAHARCHERCDRGGADLAGVHGGSHRGHPGDLVPDALRRVRGGRFVVSPGHRSGQLDGRRWADLQPELHRGAGGVEHPLLPALSDPVAHGRTHGRTHAGPVAERDRDLVAAGSNRLKLTPARARKAPAAPPPRRACRGGGSPTPRRGRRCPAGSHRGGRHRSPPRPERRPGSRRCSAP